MSFHIAVGARYSSTLVHDSVVTAFDLRPALAPAFLVSARDALRPGWSADVTLDVAPSGMRRHEGGGSFDAGSFTAVAFTVGLRREFAPGLSARAGVGGLRYLADQAGVFREGSGGIFPLGSLAATYAAPLPFAQKHQLEVEARYDIHQFITPALRTEGFSASRPVHRVAILIRMGWGKS
ncbi:MAG TPA: hypothetical protein VGQ18_03215 [Gemmatimonadales bacterium]|nr:hypothetical protein [Gemmatimonadales bacterium]